MKRVIYFCLLWSSLLFHAVASLAAEEKVPSRVMKVTVLSETPARGWTKLNGRYWKLQDVQLHSVSTIAGVPVPEQWATRLALPINPTAFGADPNAPYKYLQKGKSYLLWLHPETLTVEPDTEEVFDVLMTSNDAPVQGKIEDVVWQELKKLVDNPDAENATYGIRWLKEHRSDDMPRQHTKPVQFDKPQILNFLKDFWMAANEKVAAAALENTLNLPFGRDWPEYKNLVSALIKVADTHPSPAVRGVALRELLYVREPEVEALALRQLESESPITRSYSLLILGHAANGKMPQQLEKFARDPHPMVRQAVASVAGSMKAESLVPILVRYLIDENQDVRDTAARSLLTYAPRSVLREQIDNKEFGSLFLNKVAGNNVGAFLPQLAAQVTKENQVNASWNLLFDYVQTKSRETLESPEGQSVLEALESVTADEVKLAELYKFYLMRQMPERAAKFQANMKKRNQVAAFKETQRVDQDRTLQGKFAQTPRVD